MKTTIELDDEALALAAEELGTTTEQDTVNAALNLVADRRRREQLIEDLLALDDRFQGVGALTAASDLRCQR